MARSAAQRAARRALRASRPTFPLSRLPLELQLNVLCHCDPVSFRRLLNLSVHLSVLFLRYPESCILRLFGHLPASLFALLRTSWALHNIGDDEFDPVSVVELLSTDNSSPIVADHDDPFSVVDGLVDLYEEVHVATHLYAQSLNATMATVINPWAESKPIALSSAEYFRIATTHWMLRLFYQGQLKFSDRADIDSFCGAFLKRLERWQIEQLVSLDSWLLEVGHETLNSVYKTINPKYSDWKELSKESAYARGYFQALRFNPPQGFEWLSGEFPGGSPQTLCDVERRILFHTQRTPTRLPPWSVTVGEALSRPTQGYADTEHPLRTIGYDLYESNAEVRHIPQFRRRRCFAVSGMFFWDYNRLQRWGIAEESDICILWKEYKERVDQGLKYKFRQPLRLRLHAHYSETQKAELILRWTRSPAPCSLDEWLYQDVAVKYHSCPSFPSPYIRYKKGSEYSCFHPEGCRVHDRLQNSPSPAPEA